jgi:hypothetical protein
MLHWLYDPNRKIKRFAEENAKPKAAPVTDPIVLRIMEIAANNGMRPSDVESLAEELDGSKLQMPTDSEDRFEYLNYLMDVLLDDLHLDTAEKDFLREVCIEIGIPVDKIPYLIKFIYDGLKTEMPLSEIKTNFISLLDFTK